MTNFTDNSYFIAEINFPTSDYGNMDLFISRYEKEALILLLGYGQWKELTDAYEASLAETPVTLPQKWNDLINGKTLTIEGKEWRWEGFVNDDKISPIAYYIFCKKIASDQSAQSQLGRVIAQGENSIPADATSVVVSAWYKFRELYYSAYYFMSHSENDYDLTQTIDIPLDNIYGL